jgi:hypothetical protein
VHREAVGGPVALQARDDVAVELYGVQVRQTFEQGLGQRAQAGADFEDGFAGLRMYGVDDGIDDAVVDEEVLAEAFAGCTFRVWDTALWPQPMGKWSPLSLSP